MRLLARAATAALLAITPVAAASASADVAPEPTPVPLTISANAIPGQYIVTLEPGYDPAKVAERLGLKPKFLYTKAMSGFAVPMTKLQLEIARVALGVKSVEADAKVSAPSSVPSTATALRGPSASWGLDRIDQKLLPLDNTFTAEGNGAGVNAYILDTGIEYAHDEFGGRATFGFDAIKDGRDGLDCNGHGTHVAGTVAGKTYGVARKANLVSVRVLDCKGEGDTSGIIAGLDWVAKNAKQPAVLNGSLGGDKSQAVNDAANAVTDAGVLPVIAAGNSSKDACLVSPASAGKVLTVAASNQWDEETSFSNFGECVSLYAPGEAVVSAKLGGGSVAENGTSMAAPHVTGVAVLYKAANPGATPEAIVEYLGDEATKDVLKSISKSSPNSLLFTNGL
ncbi:S8 family peptidase [Streptomyces sp. NBC_00335]|uniref:S8 family peptidase n=1 Tax=unclassified Streptomyces TaxID=2593676 RepID=UPI0022563B53|nr:MULTISPECIES: S8 family peptidase [unclassified Streptomyces]MCX5406335.1 S8 family peptidase [Streptomyces sp. NBC_00086]